MSSPLYLRFVGQFARFEEPSKRTFTVKTRRPDQAWLTADVLATIKRKEISWTRCRRSPNNLEQRSHYVMERNHVTALLRSVKRKVYSKHFSEAHFNIRKAWSLINELKGTYTPSSIDSPIEKSYLPINLRRACMSSAYLPGITEDDLHLILFSFS